MRKRFAFFDKKLMLAFLSMVLMNRITLVVGFYQPSMPCSISSTPRISRVATFPLSSSSSIETSTRTTQTSAGRLKTINSNLSLPSFRIPKVFTNWTKFWWSLPLALALFPFYCVLTGSCPAMPQWWPVVCLQGIFGAYWWPVIGGFLASNISYFASGVYLMDKFYNRQKFRMLGIWLLTAGLVSTIYHSVQALVGVNALSETLAYIDHGIALSAGCYYLDTCGWPSKKVWALGLSGITCLAVCNSPELYAILHSCWHGLSAATATIWALQGYKRNRMRLKLQRIRNFLLL